MLHLSDTLPIIYMCNYGIICFRLFARRFLYWCATRRYIGFTIAHDKTATCSYTAVTIRTVKVRVRFAFPLRKRKVQTFTSIVIAAVDYNTACSVIGVYINGEKNYQILFSASVLQNFVT